MSAKVVLSACAVALVASSTSWWPARAAAPQAPNGEGLYRTACASCHDRPAEGSRAQTRDALKDRAPEAIVDALTAAGKALRNILRVLTVIPVWLIVASMPSPGAPDEGDEWLCAVFGCADPGHGFVVVGGSGGGKYVSCGQLMSRPTSSAQARFSANSPQSCSS
jgi:hypothetical protein